MRGARGNPSPYRDHARTELFAYIESYYNTHRRHSSLDYLTPTQFEALNHTPN